MPSLRHLIPVFILSLLPGFVSADVVVIVSVKSPVGGLEKGQVSDIFLGKSATFPGGALAIPLDQDSSSGAHNEFHDKITGKSGAQLKAYWSKLVFTGKATPPKEIVGPAEIRSLIATNPNMIGYIDKGLVDPSVKVVFSP